MAVYRSGIGGNHGRRQTRIRAKTIVLILLFVTIAGLVYLLHLSYSVAMKNMKKQNDNDDGGLSKLKPEIPTPPDKIDGSINNHSQKVSSSSRKINHDKCAFRSYPSNRLYGLFSKKSPQPKFLSEAAYIRGQWPIILNPKDNDNKLLENNGSKVVQQTSPVKVCIDTTSWENLIDKNGNERLPFTDGHNPSVISLASNPYSNSKSSDDTYNSNQQHDQQHIRLDPKHLSPLANAFLAPLSSLFMGVTIFGGGQCKFGLTLEDVDNYRFSLYDEPQGGKRAVIAILAPPNNNPNDKSSSSTSSFQTLGQTTLLLERDVKYGKNRRAIQPGKTSSGGGFARMHQEFDDPRLFFHLGRVWILYRNGPLFGYNDQIHNPIHFEKVSSSSSSSGGEGDKSGSGGDGGVKFVAYVKASETVRVGGGRNIALISEEPLGVNERGEVEWVSNPDLKALTWVDPVTVKDDIDLGDVEGKLLSSNRRLLLEVGNANEDSAGDHGVAMANNSFHRGPSIESFSEHRQSQQHRRLGSKPTKSNIHGTNGYMVPLQSTGELLGIAHFHRPENRKASDFALHGHHYTHAFFTIARQASSGDSTKDIGSRPFKLKRLSNEFVFRANSLPAGEMQLPNDGDVIQFASGIDVVGSDIDGQLVISYGVNDCEGVVFTLAMEMVQRMLIGVDPGQEVVDLMENVQR